MFSGWAYLLVVVPVKDEVECGIFMWIRKTHSGRVNIQYLSPLHLADFKLNENSLASINHNDQVPYTYTSFK